MEHNPNEKWLIDHLRNEAMSVKDCFTQFAFQTLAFSVTVFVFLVTSFGWKSPPESFYLALISSPAILLIATVSRIGIYKYGTANRHYGYELFCDRINNHIVVDDDADLYRKLVSVGWEDALRAWRVVQTSILKSLYNVTELRSEDKLFNRIPVLRWIRHIHPSFYNIQGDIKDVIDKSPIFARHQPEQ